MEVTELVGTSGGSNRNMSRLINSSTQSSTLTFMAKTVNTNLVSLVFSNKFKVKNCIVIKHFSSCTVGWFAYLEKHKEKDNC